MLRYDRQTKPGLVALYDIRPGNGAGPFLQPRSPHGAERTIRYFFKQHSIIICSANSVIMSVVEVFIHSVEYSKLCNSAC